MNKEQTIKKIEKAKMEIFTIKENIKKQQARIKELEQLIKECNYTLLEQIAKNQGLSVEEFLNKQQTQQESFQ